MSAWNNAQTHELNWWLSIEGKMKEVLERTELSAQVIEKKMKELGQGVPPSLIEIGTGANGFVNFMHFGQKVGVEPLYQSFRTKGIGLFRDDVRWIEGQGEKIPLPDSAFGFAILFNVIDHTENPKLILSELRRLMTDRAVLYFMVDTYSFSYVLLKLIRPNQMHPHTYTPAMIHRLMKKFGFQPVLIEDDKTATGGWGNRIIRRFYILHK